MSHPETAMRPVKLTIKHLQISKRHAPTAIAALFLVAAGIGACAELDAQDASNTSKLDKQEPKQPPSQVVSSSVPSSGESVTPALEEGLIDLAPLEPSHPVHHTEPMKSTESVPPTASDTTQDVAAPTSLEVSSSVIASPAAATIDQSVTTPSEPPFAAWFPRPHCADSLAWSVLGTQSPTTIEPSPSQGQVPSVTVPMAVPPASDLQPALTSESPTPPADLHSIEQPIVSTPDDAPATESDQTLAALAAKSVAGSAPATEQDVHAPTPIASKPKAEPDLHSPVPVRVEAPLKPIVIDVAAPLSLPACISQRPIAPAIARPAPPSASVHIATASQTDGPASTPIIPMLLLAATILAAVATGGLAFIVSGTTDVGGVARRSLNIACRLTLAFGAVAAIILASCWYGAASAASVGSQITFCVFSVAATTLCVGGGLWLSRSIVRPIEACLGSIRALAAGNLMVAPMNSIARDELGELSRASDKLAATIKDIISEIAISSSEVAAAAGEIAVGAQGMSVAAGQVSNQCAVASGDASATGRHATSGGRAIQQATEEIARIDSFVRERTDEVSELADRGRQIARVVQLIDDISDRTHLVALNASIEASKAGPNGRAFAVLADEVRRLAERALKAVEEATATVRNVQDDTRSAAEKMSFGALQIKQSADMAGRASHDLAEIIRTSGGVSTMIRTISAAAEEAGAGAAQSASAAAQLCTRAEDLKAMVSRFRIDTTPFMKHAASPNA
jgi:methyl-accepting chemotaxis protein